MKQKILLVDDEKDFLEMLKLRLEANGYEVITASEGKDAIKLIKSKNPDAVFLDILMPQMDGLEVLKEIRQIDKDLPVFIITGFSNEERFRMANKLNASGFLVKTSDMKDEIANIEGVLRLSAKFKAAKKE